MVSSLSGQWAVAVPTLLPTSSPGLQCFPAAVLEEAPGDQPFCASKCHPPCVGHPILGFQPSGVWEPNEGQDGRMGSTAKRDTELPSCAFFLPQSTLATPVISAVPRLLLLLDPEWLPGATAS